MHIVTPSESLRGNPVELGVQYGFTNDNRFWRKYDAVRALQERVRPDTGRVGVQIGTGGLFSMIDALPKTMYITDYCPKVLDWVASQVALLRTAPNPAAFLDALQLDQQSIKYSLDVEMISFRSIYHFLRSQERYDVARTSIEETDLRYIEMNYGDSADVAALGDYLRGEQQVVGYFNATNVAEHAAVFGNINGYLAALEGLPWAPQYRILAASARYKSLIEDIPAYTSLEAYSAAIQA